MSSPLWPLLLVGGEQTVIHDMFYVLACAAVVAIVIQRVRLAVIPGYLITGAIVGPGALGLVDSPASLAIISQLAVILLMFGIGLHLELAFLRRGLVFMIMAGLGSCLLTIGVGLPTAIAFGLDTPAALAVAMALSLSSTAVVLRALSARRDLRRPNGRLSFAILIIQDLLVVGMLVVLPLLARKGGVETRYGMPTPWALLFMEGLVRILGVAGLVVFGKLTIPRLVQETARARTPEVMMILSVAVAIGAAVVTTLLGFSPEMGAFLAGFLLSSTPFRHALRGQIGPLRDLFMAVFFVTVGMNLDLAALAEGWWVVLLGSLILCVIKTFAIGSVVWALGASASVSVLVGLSLAQAGEFSLVLLERAHILGIISDATTANVIAVVVMSLILTPSLMQLGIYLAQHARFPRAPWWPSSPLDFSEGERSGDDPRPRRARGHVIVAGFGTVGRVVAEHIEDLGHKVVFLELNAATVRRQSRRGVSISYGDTSDPEVLEAVKIHRAQALVIAIPDEEAALRAVQTARRLNPDLYIAVRTSFPAVGQRAEQLGASHVTVEEIATAADLSRAVESKIGRVEPEGDVEENDEESVELVVDPDEPGETGDAEVTADEASGGAEDAGSAAEDSATEDDVAEDDVAEDDAAEDDARRAEREPEPTV